MATAADPVVAPLNASLRRRRLVFTALVLFTIIAMTAGLSWVLSRNGLSTLDLAMILLFSLTTPWTSIGFWNALIGLWLLHGTHDPVSRVNPLINTPLAHQSHSRTAVVMPIYNEAPDQVFRHLATVVESLDSIASDTQVEFFLLSDTQQRDIQREEEARFAAWRSRTPQPERLHYRHRADNTGNKAGNLRDFCDNQGREFDYMLVLDADSVMSGEAILQLIQMMDANPNLGILQTLVVGLPAYSPFARIFQFGMRQAMRPYTLGSAWWQGDQGPYWGHNAILRLVPFREHCQLPILPGEAPLGGRILSHDQVEAVLMRRAGFEVRVLPIENGSYEQNPPTLPDFLKRDLRWCQGNMQYLRLLGLEGILPLGRVQLLLAILMYLSAPFWLLFLLLGLLQVQLGNGIIYHTDGLPLGLLLFAVMMIMVFTPKIVGVLDLLLKPQSRAAYGGASRILASAGLELLFAILLGPLLALTHSVFIVRLFLGQQVIWEAQNRSGHAVPLNEALRGLWLHTLVGLLISAMLLATVPIAFLWALPFLLSLLLAIPFTTLSSLPGPGQWLARWQLCAIPEEFQAPPEVAALQLEKQTWESLLVEDPSSTTPAQIRVGDD